MENLINWCNTNGGFLSAILSVVTLIISIVAIWVSISVSRKQNRIALFEKRATLHSKFVQIKNFRDSLNLQGLPPGMLYTQDVWAGVYLSFFFNTHSASVPSDAFQKMTTCLEILNLYCNELQSTKYLFQLDLEALNEINSLCENYQHFVSDLLTSGNMDYLEKFKNSSDTLFKNTIPKIEKQMKI